MTNLFFGCFPVDGSYNDWSAWTTCSMSCGGGVKFRHRNCSNPAPMHGGRDCSLIGPATESDSCNSQPCPGGLSHSNFSGATKRVVLQCIALDCTVLYYTVLYCTAVHYTVLYCTVLYCTALHCTALHCTVLYCTALQYTILYCTVLYCTVSCIALHYMHRVLL